MNNYKKKWSDHQNHWQDMEFYLYQRKMVDYNYVWIISHSMQLWLRINTCYHELMKYKIELEEQNSLWSSTLQMHIIDYESIKVKNKKQPFRQNMDITNT